MSHLVSVPTLAALFDFNFPPHMISVLVPITVFIVGGMIVIGSLYFQHLHRKLWHETARIALEKGQPVPEPPPEDDDERRPVAAVGGMESARMQRCRGLIIAGLVNLAVGAGLFLALFKVGVGNASYFAAIPAFVGVALFLSAWIDIVLLRKMEK